MKKILFQLFFFFFKRLTVYFKSQRFFSECLQKIPHMLSAANRKPGPCVLDEKEWRHNHPAGSDIITPQEVQFVGMVALNSFGLSSLQWLPEPKYSTSESRVS